MAVTAIHEFSYNAMSGHVLFRKEHTKMSRSIKVMLP